MMEDVNDGVTPQQAKNMGPLGNAILLLKKAIMHAVKEKVYNSSPTFKAIAVVIDHVDCQREALWKAVDLVNALENNLIGTDSIPRFIEEFKKAAVKARMQQFVPESKLKEYNDEFETKLTRGELLS